MKAQFTNVTVLMATWNGAHWISEQLDSIFAQSNCNIQLIVSDDRSTDDTLSILKNAACNQPLFIMPYHPSRFGSANRNFIHLILNSNVDNADFISLSDQDDIWHNDKLQRAIVSLVNDDFDAYSSNVMAYWEGGRSVLLEKSGTQKSFDYLFESAGPGCTFVIKKARFLELRDWVRKNIDSLKNFTVHDWFIYAYARSRGWKWYIDEIPGMKYRQHLYNEIGANVGIRAAGSRFIKFLKSDYLNNSLAIGELTVPNTRVVKALRNFSFFDLFYLLLNAGDYRRRYSEIWALRVLLVIYWIYKGLRYDPKKHA